MTDGGGCRCLATRCRAAAALGRYRELRSFFAAWIGLLPACAWVVAAVEAPGAGRGWLSGRDELQGLVTVLANGLD